MVNEWETEAVMERGERKEDIGERREEGGERREDSTEIREGRERGE